jgi:hypothetical protein
MQVSTSNIFIIFYSRKEKNMYIKSLFNKMILNEILIEKYCNRNKTISELRALADNE